MDNYYLYRHIRLDTNEVFYIGIGTGKRAYSKFSRNRYWKHIVNNTDYEVEIVIDNLHRLEAEAKEIEFIKMYGRKDLKEGTLCNLIDGGTGGLGLKHTEEAKSKMKGRISHNKDNFLYQDKLADIIIDIKGGLSEKKIKDKYGCSNGTIWRIKKKIFQSN